jgi:two-component system alkaline phosphatase synthesis response regulator PhoP
VNKIVILEEDQTMPSSGIRGNRENGVDDGRGAVESGDLEISLVIDKPAYTVYLEGIRISFPKKEFELLLLLATNPRKVFKRNDILEHIWGKDFKQKDSRSLDVHIRMLRKKLNDNYITTIRGVGYKLEK